MSDALVGYIVGFVVGGAGGFAARAHQTIAGKVYLGESLTRTQWWSVPKQCPTAASIALSFAEWLPNSK